jgi:acetyl/propionyl-CoA carboxylase alpha subunit
MEVSAHYDPLISKLIVWGEDRASCLARAERALREYRVEGITTTLSFFRRVLHDPRFRAGDIDVGYIDRIWKVLAADSQEVSPKNERDRVALIAAALAAYQAETKSRTRVVSSRERSAWAQRGISEQHGSRL